MNGMTAISCSPRRYRRRTLTFRRHRQRRRTFVVGVYRRQALPIDGYSSYERRLVGRQCIDSSFLRDRVAQRSCTRDCDVHSARLGVSQHEDAAFSEPFFVAVLHKAADDGARIGLNDVHLHLYEAHNWIKSSKRNFDGIIVLSRTC